MKKLFALLLALMMVFALAACGSDSSQLGNDDGKISADDVVKDTLEDAE